MNKSVLLVLRLFGFKRVQPKTHLGKNVRRFERVLNAVALFWVGLLVFPQLLFHHNVTYQGVTIYSRAPLPPETTARIEEIMSLVGGSELSVRGRTERIFVCNNRWLFYVLSPFTPRAFGFSVPVVDNVIIAEADLVYNVARSASSVHNQHPFSAVAAHEITHGLIGHRLGMWREFCVPRWVKEGYCDYVTRASTFPEAEGYKLLTTSGHDPSMSFRYFTYHQMVRHLMDDQGCSFEQLVDRAGELALVEAETVRAIEDAGSQ
jgi:hypothetical protein